MYRDKLNAINSVFMQIDYICERNIRFLALSEPWWSYSVILGFHFSRSNGRKMFVHLSFRPFVCHLMLKCRRSAQADEKNQL